MWKKIIRTIIVAVLLTVCGVTAGGVKWGAPMIENLTMETAPENAIKCGENTILIKKEEANQYRIYARSNNKWALAMDNIEIRNEGAEQARDAEGKWVGKGQWVIEFQKDDDTIVIIEQGNLDKLLEKSSDNPANFDRTLGAQNAIWNKNTKCIYLIEGPMTQVTNKGDMGDPALKGKVFYRVKIDAANGLDMSQWQVENSKALKKCGVHRTPWLVPNVIGDNIIAGMESLVNKMGPWTAITIYIAAVLAATGILNGYISGKNRLLKEDKAAQIEILKKEYANRPDELQAKMEKLENTYNEMKPYGWLNIAAKIIEMYCMFFVVDYVGAFRGVTLGASDLGLPENCGLGNLGGLWNGAAKYLPRAGFFNLLLIWILMNTQDMEETLGNTNKWIMGVIFLFVFGNRSLVSILIYIVYAILKTGINNVFYLLEKRKGIRRVL